MNALQKGPCRTNSTARTRWIDNENKSDLIEKMHLFTPLTHYFDSSCRSHFQSPSEWTKVDRKGMKNFDTLRKQLL